MEAMCWWWNVVGCNWAERRVQNTGAKSEPIEALNSLLRALKSVHKKPASHNGRMGDIRIKD
jgi:hypothetical protein